MTNSVVTSHPTAHMEAGVGSSKGINVVSGLVQDLTVRPVISLSTIVTVSLVRSGVTTNYGITMARNQVNPTEGVAETGLPSVGDSGIYPCNIRTGNVVSELNRTDLLVCRLIKQDQVVVILNVAMLVAFQPVTVI